MFDKLGVPTLIAVDGKCYKEFLNDRDYWGTKATHTRALLVNGKLYGGKEDDELNDISDDSEVTIVEGTVYYDSSFTKKYCSYLKFFRRWLKARTTSKPRPKPRANAKISMHIKVPIDRVPDIVDYLESIGGEVK